MAAAVCCRSRSRRRALPHLVPPAPPPPHPRSCYPIWMDFSECMSKAEDPKACRDFRDDYLECLHHRKEVGGC